MTLAERGEAAARSAATCKRTCLSLPWRSSRQQRRGRRCWIGRGPRVRHHCRFHENRNSHDLSASRRRCCSRTPAATRSRWSIRLLRRGRRCRCLLDAGLTRATADGRMDPVEPGGRTAPFSRSSSEAGRGYRPARKASLLAQRSSPALTCIMGARLAWIALMISSVLIPWRYTLVVDTYECPSCRWITGSGTPSRASSTA
jgi:hypothetical protein